MLLPLFQPRVYEYYIFTVLIPVSIIIWVSSLNFKSGRAKTIWSKDVIAFFFSFFFQREKYYSLLRIVVLILLGKKVHFYSICTSYADKSLSLTCFFRDFDSEQLYHSIVCKLSLSVQPLKAKELFFKIKAKRRITAIKGYFVCKRIPGKRENTKYNEIVCYI